MDLTSDSIARYFFDSYAVLLKLMTEEVHWVGQRIPLPAFEKDNIAKLFTETKSVLARSSVPVVTVPFPAWVIGDLHGNFHDLLRILASMGDWRLNPIVFLGDYVDRGCYSFDVIILLFTLKCTFPEKIHLLRGNHEFSALNCTYGFKDEAISRFGSEDLWTLANDVFNYMPFCAILGKQIVCVHGGIGPKAKSVDRIVRIEVPVECHQLDDIISEVVWSDPLDSIEDFVVNERGSGVQFGPLATNQFLKASGCRKIFRGHQCVKHGVHAFSHGNGLTIFSTSDYCGRGNAAGFVLVCEDGSVCPSILSPLLEVVKREDAVFAEPAPRMRASLGEIDNVGLPSALTMVQRRSSVKALAAVNHMRRPSLGSINLKPQRVVDLLHRPAMRVVQGGCHLPKLDSISEEKEVGDCDHGKGDEAN
jgi:protein phosphatase